MIIAKIKRIIGLDLGSKTCGIAVSDPLGYTAQGLKTIRFEEDSYKKAIRLLKEELAKYDIDKFILGNPKHMNGDLSESSQRSINFKKRLEDNFKVEVILWDERLTSVIADNFMISINMSREKRKQSIDKLAAVSILQAYLDSIK
ncbi:Holliday junction resolvase RuvX [Mycoplasma sp. P36-A1]|uniref:Holliday junction resolvase RuvX n=1 Tax=Mycoplasma sp. P36-A1 TaxID=3252900 RepID=UPI003C2E5728